MYLEMTAAMSVLEKLKSGTECCATNVQFASVCRWLVFRIVSSTESSLTGQSRRLVCVVYQLLEELAKFSLNSI
jgi:hypothetical protein